MEKESAFVFLAYAFVMRNVMVSMALPVLRNRGRDFVRIVQGRVIHCAIKKHK